MYQEAFRSGPVITKVLTEICLEWNRKRTKNLSQNSRFSRPRKAIETSRTQIKSITTTHFNGL